MNTPKITNKALKILKEEATKYQDEHSFPPEALGFDFDSPAVKAREFSGVIITLCNILLKETQNDQ
uniref:Uncharacterized protein n=1 Tax=viral metagenome TaxID=1070528 RepID=A0A6M3JPT7_9ZZZZ